MKGDNQGHPEPRTKWCAREESDLDIKLRKLAFYPLNYGRLGASLAKKIVKINPSC